MEPQFGFMWVEMSTWGIRGELVCLYLEQNFNKKIGSLNKLSFFFQSVVCMEKKCKWDDQEHDMNISRNRSCCHLAIHHVVNYQNTRQSCWQLIDDGKKNAVSGGGSYSQTNMRGHWEVWYHSFPQCCYQFINNWQMGKEVISKIYKH